MLACIACNRDVQGTGVEAMDEDKILKSPAARETIRSLSHQLKAVAVRFSAGAYRHCKPCTSPDVSNDVSCMDTTEASSEVSPASRGRSSSGALFSTPSRNFQTRTTCSVSPSRNASSVLQDVDSVERGSSPPPTQTEGEGKTEDELEKEWVAQVEPGVLIAFVTRADGRNDLKRIRFSRERFSKLQAYDWWSKNREKVQKLYNVPLSNGISRSEET